MRITHRQSGYTLVEITIALALVGGLAALTIISWVSNSASKHAVSRTKLVAQELTAARTTFKSRFPTDTPNARQLGDLTKFLSSQTCTTNLMTAPRAGELNCGSGCRCYRFPDGGMLQLEDPGPVNGSPEYLRFSYDPDGAQTNGGIPPIGIRLYVETGRVTSYGADISSAAEDPEYGAIWTKY